MNGFEDRGVLVAGAAVGGSAMLAGEDGAFMNGVEVRAGGGRSSSCLTAGGLDDAIGEQVQMVPLDGGW